MEIVESMKSRKILIAVDESTHSQIAFDCKLFLFGLARQAAGEPSESGLRVGFLTRKGLGFESTYRPSVLVATSLNANLP